MVWGWSSEVSGGGGVELVVIDENPEFALVNRKIRRTFLMFDYNKDGGSLCINDRSTLIRSNWNFKGFPHNILFIFLNFNGF